MVNGMHDLRIPTLPLKSENRMNLKTHDVVPKKGEGSLGKGFCEYIGEVVSRWNLSNVNKVVLHVVSYEVVANVDVFRFCLKLGILRELNSREIVVKERVSGGH